MLEYGRDFPFGPTARQASRPEALHFRKRYTRNSTRVMDTLLKILIVDDESSQRTGLAGMVKAWGMQAETATDGSDALDKLERFPADVIVTDLNMPRMDGYELMRTLREEGQNVPVIVVTAFGNVETAVRTVHEMGAYWFLEKPVQANVMQTLLRRAAAHHGLGTEKEDARAPASIQRFARRNGGQLAAHAGNFLPPAASRPQ